MNILYRFHSLIFHRIKKMKPKIITGLFLALVLIFFSCGPNNGHNSSNGSHITGSYHANLVFPADIPQVEETDAKVLRGIDCDELGIAVIRFTFLDADDLHLVSDQFPCSDHHATVAGLPAGNDRRVVVTAENQDGEVLLRGEERNITIRANEDTKGGYIVMTSVPSDIFTNELGMTFNLLPSGTFMMGSPETELGRNDNEIQHEVTETQGFYMQTTEVTQGQWQAVMGENPSRFQNCGLDCPVENVSWDGIQEFLTRLNNQTADPVDYRLPTEAEWEYAARAGSDTAFYEGDITVSEGNDPILNTLGWYLENSDANYAGCVERDGGRCTGPQPVSGKNPNVWGLYDMHGNVWEWCSDWYGDYPSGSVTDPHGPSSGGGRVVRGGSWDYFAAYCRSASRMGISPAQHSIHIGLRLVAYVFYW